MSSYKRPLLEHSRERDDVKLVDNGVLVELLLARMVLTGGEILSLIDYTTRDRPIRDQ